MKKEKVLLAGGSGTIGQILAEKLTNAGYEVGILSRSEKTHPRYTYHKWNPVNGEIDPEVLKYHYLVNLFGNGIVDKPWTKKYRESIISSRTLPHETMINLLRTGQHEYRKVVNASAIGFYGNSKTKTFDEGSEAGSEGFLPEVCMKWEAATIPYEEIGIPSVILRIGIVLTRKEGFLKKLFATLPFRILAYPGPGSQQISFIHITDLCDMIMELIKNKESKGVYNAVANSPISMNEFVRSVKRNFRGPLLSLKAPSFILGLIFGSRIEAVISDQKVISSRMKETGFKLKYPDIDSAIRNLLD